MVPNCSEYNKDTRMKPTICTFVRTLQLLLAIISPSALAKPLDDAITQKYFQDSLQKCDTLLSHWALSWKIAVGLAVVVVILGAVSALLQGFQSRPTKVATAICGLMVTIITGLTNTIGLDHRELNNHITKGQIMIAQMNRWVAIYGYPGQNDESKRSALDAFGKLQIDFFGLQQRHEGLTPTNDVALGVVGDAHAEGAPAPDWLRNVPIDSNNLYFVGIADAATLADAKTAARDNAIQNAAAFLAGTLKTTGGELDIDKLALSLAQASNDVDTYVTYDPKTRFYRYYALIKINKPVAEAQVQLFAVQHGAVAPASLIKSLGNSQRVRDDYAARQLVQYEALLDATKSTLSADQYQKFVVARDLRKDKKDYEHAVAMLNELLQSKPDFYMGWYNLALAYAAAGNDAPAQQAYRKAIALEPMQPLRDATIYNAYGHFLYERSEYCDALAQINKSIELDPNNPRAVNNFQQVKSGLQAAGRVCP